MRREAWRWAARETEGKVSDGEGEREEEKGAEGVYSRERETEAKNDRDFRGVKAARLRSALRLLPCSHHRFSLPSLILATATIVAAVIVATVAMVVVVAMVAVVVVVVVRLTATSPLSPFILVPSGPSADEATNPHSAPLS